MAKATMTPSGERLALAFIVAPAAPILLVMCVVGAMSGFERGAAAAWGAVYGTGIFGVMLAYPPTVIIGAPLYLVLRNTNRVTFANAALVGAVLGVLPALLLGMPASLLALAAGLGALGGFVFWRVHEGGRRETPHPSGSA